MKFAHLLAAAAVACAALAAQAQPAPTPGSGAQQQPGAAPLVEGEVRKVDLPQGKLTLRHGPIPNLDMPPMSMVFRVADPRMLDTVKPGDKVRFTADEIDGALTVTSLRAAD
ncbi:copper-binding protein [Pseudorhodoferax soli]|uniref:Cu/Ag efflux protein CusF n=1 Tax=Pseudorhodoferax soli TaxID=545864 RepID=A0A368XHD4_9BURK|nr:copper-binding protein [Pseudorhodoferax soli]RCW67410.1 Cu/Ag efflux protein CusF [Pseudorhodoferax soli]